jgi:hypothetical protein
MADRTEAILNSAHAFICFMSADCSARRNSIAALRLSSIELQKLTLKYLPLKPVPVIARTSSIIVAGRDHVLRRKFAGVFQRPALCAVAAAVEIDTPRFWHDDFGGRLEPEHGSSHILHVMQ